MARSSHQSQSSTTAPVYRGKPEDILVVPREVLAQHALLPAAGMKSFDQKMSVSIEQLIREHGKFKPRELMEVDENFKQIIPFCFCISEQAIYNAAQWQCK